jgi:hypothetical protein
MMLPKGVFVSLRLFGNSQLRERLCSILLQVIDDPSANNSVYEAVDLFGSSAAISDEMKVVGHDDIRKDKKSSRPSRFSESIARDLSNCRCTENREAVLSDGRQIIGRGVFTNYEHMGGVASQKFNADWPARQASPQCIAASRER